MKNSTQHATRNTHNDAPFESGIVKFFKNGNGKGTGYGFISRDGQEDIYVHITEVVGASESDRQLFAGDKVSFQIGKGRDDRERALNVRVQIRNYEPPVKVHHD